MTRRMPVPEMQYTALGASGVRVSVAGLGCGGFSRLGLGRGGSEADAIAVVREALELGVNFIDTAAAYGTEGVVGRALAGRPRDSFVLSTKSLVIEDGKVLPAERVVESLERSLAALDLDWVDVFHLHAVPPWALDQVVDSIVPALERAREAGKLRLLGITETAPADPGHEMLPRAAASGRFAVMMVAHHMLHQKARESLFPVTTEAGIGTLLMFAVRLIFSQPERLRTTLHELAASGQIPEAIADSPDTLGFLVHEGGASSIIDAAYRFCRHEPGVDVVLFGTGSIEHLRTNVASILAGAAAGRRPGASGEPVRPSRGRRPRRSEPPPRGSRTARRAAAVDCAARGRAVARGGQSSSAPSSFSSHSLRHSPPP